MDLTGNINMSKEMKKLVYVGAGVSTIFGVLHLLKNGYDPKLITIIDKGNSIWDRKPTEVMTGGGGSGTFSDYKVIPSFKQGGLFYPHYCQDKELANKLSKQLYNYIIEYHPDPTKIMYTEPVEEPQFIKDSPFELRQSPCYHLGTDYGQQQVKNIFEYFDSVGVRQIYNVEITNINFKRNEIGIGHDYIKYDNLIIGTGKSGMDLLTKLIEENNLDTVSKPAQFGVRYETDGKYFEELNKIAYDFKLYKKFGEDSARSFCLPGTEKIQIERNKLKKFINIEEVLNDDKILTYDFNNQKCKFIKPKTLFSREYEGNLITINNKLTTTEDHIYFVWEKEKIKDEYNRKDGYKDDALKLNRIVEKNAKDLIIGDRLVTPKNFPKLNDLKGTNYTNEQLWMFGLWFADRSGQYNSKWNTNSFNLTNEDYILNKIIDILNKQNENYSSKKQYDNYSVLNFSSKILKEFLINEECFQKGKHRGLPKSIFNWSEEEIYSFLSGLIDGDGRIKKEYNICLDYFTVSDLLYRDLIYLFNYLGISYKSRTRKQSTNFKEDSQINIINIAQRDSILLLSNKLILQNINKNKLLKENINIEFQERDNKNYEKIYSIESEYYKGTVYDFEIENTHNFIVGKTPLVIHNCTNNFAAFVAEEETYGMKSYNGHAHKNKEKYNGLTNFGILLEARGIEDPFNFSKQLVEFFQNNGEAVYYSPSNREPSLTDQGNKVPGYKISLDKFKEGFGKYADYILEFIDDLNQTFGINDNYIFYCPEVKFLTNEILLNKNNLSLPQYPNIHLQGDAAGARGIYISALHGIYVASSILQNS
jgi:uncharacterized FAD-dependent dehydrogenase/intein/homing endonuclease